MYPVVLLGLKMPRPPRGGRRALDHMVDTDMRDVEEIAEDASGHWEEASPSAPEFASWLLDLYELEDMVGPQAYPPEGVTSQHKLFS